MIFDQKNVSGVMNVLVENYNYIGDKTIVGTNNTIR